MSSEKLTNAPLVEAIFEMRWGLAQEQPGLSVDPKYKVLVGRLYERLEKDYPFHEPLPTSSMPDEMMGYVVQHRFRAAETKWPLVQVGPGIVTLNDTDKYAWPDFEKRIHLVQKHLFEAYPSAPESLKVTSIQLRYIDAVPFNYKESNVFDFMSNKLKVNFELSPAVFEDRNVCPFPVGFHFLSTFPTTSPKGTLRLRFGRGNSERGDTFVWETIVQSEAGDVPEIPAEFPQWIRSAHSLTHGVFFKMIRGELEESFR